MTFIAKNLRFLRKLSKQSQHGFAEEVGLNRGNIASYEKGTAEPNTTNLLKISRFFEVDLTDFIEKDLEAAVEQEKLEVQVASDAVKFERNTLEDLYQDHDMEEGEVSPLQILTKRSLDLKKIVIGFRQFQALRKAQLPNPSPTEAGLLIDYDRMLGLALDLLDINRQLVVKLAATE